MAHHTPTPTEARHALHDADALGRAASSTLPERAIWYEVAYSAYFAGIVVTVALPRPFSFPLLAVLLAGIGFATRTYRQRYGVWVSGFRAGATRTIAIALAVALLAITASVYVAVSRHGLFWPAPVGALLAAAIAFVLNRAWMRAYRRQTGADR